MRDWTDHELLDAWERGLDRPVVERALVLLAAADPSTPLDTLADLSVGRRDGRLLELHARIFGPRLVGLAECPTCGLRVELVLDAADLRGQAADDETSSREVFTFEAKGCSFQFRLPTSRDLAAIAEFAGDNEQAAQLLLSRCVLAADVGGLRAKPDDVPEEAIQALIAQMAETDPRADLQIALGCPGCGGIWQAGFDIGSFFWAELQNKAIGMLREVHALASAYGWSESAVLALSPRRRRLYREMIGA
jgi:hypothetical protein